MALDRTRVTDGFTSLEGGMDGGSATNLIPRNKYYFGRNVTARTGYINNRPGYNQIQLIFQNQEIKTAYETGKFQGASTYTPLIGNTYLFVSVSGRIYRILAGGIVEDLTPSGDPNMSTLPQVWMCQADTFMVIQDGRDDPFIFDGTILRRSNPGRDPNAIPGTLPSDQINYYEVPTGTAMAYGYGRLFLVRGKNIEAGDILDASIPNSAIRFSEVIQFQDSFSVPVTSGNITALNFGANLDTSLGQGPLQAHTASGDIITLNITTDRKSWTTTNIQVIAMRGGAATGQNAVINVNGDTWYRSADGIRSFIVALRQFNQWGNTPQSRELNQILSFDEPTYLKYVSGVCFDNRLLITISPQVQGENIIFQGLSVLDFDLLGALADSIFSGVYGTTPKPAYDGIWDGLNITQITKAYFGTIERCFIFTCHADQGNQFWELSKRDPFDNGNCPVTSLIETGSYNYGQLTRLKKLIAADIFIDQMQGQVNFNFKFLPEQYPFWTDWQAFEESDGGICSLPDPLNGTCQVPATVPTQYRSRLRLQQPPDSMDNSETDYPMDVGYDFRFRIEWTGRVRIKGFRVHGYLQEEETTGEVPQ